MHGDALTLLHVDDSLIVIDKPGGLLSVPGRGVDKQDSLAARVQARYADACIVHRLDMATSGLMVMARGPAAQRALSHAFATRQVSKRYVAVVAGQMQAPADSWSVIDLPLIADWPNRPRQKVDALHGKPSVTRWRILDHDVINGTTRVELEPVTGRTHQLRVHLCALGHPIMGDALYAPPDRRDETTRLHLHAAMLTLTHPVTGVQSAFSSAVPF